MRALQGTRIVSREASRMALYAVMGAIQAADEIGKEAGGFVKDTVIGVVESTGELARTTTPVVRDIVVGAIRGSSDAGASLNTAGRLAVEGAIRGAASLGISAESAVTQATRGAIQAAQDMGESLVQATIAVVGGVIEGVHATGGDVTRAAYQATGELIREVLAAGESAADASVRAVDTAIEVSIGLDLDAEEVASATAAGAVKAAYDASESAGILVSEATLACLNRSFIVAREAGERNHDTMRRLAEELSRRPGVWRGQALWRAGRTLAEIGGLDMAAALAYFAMLSFFPMLALTIIIFSAFVGVEAMQAMLADVLAFYFPASEELLTGILEHLFESRLAAGLIALLGIIIGANGLFMASNRAINRIFGVRPRRIISTTLVEMALAVIVVGLFVIGIGLSAGLRIGMELGYGLSGSSLHIGRVVIFLSDIASTVIPFLLTWFVFAFVYRVLPNARVRWRDATFGAIIAVVLFEAAKHLFFWFTTVATQRSLVYGSLSSAIILLIWSAVAGFIFLYGTALTKESSALRPTESTDDT